MQTVLVAGASRGIGLECAKQYAEKGCRVVATCRDLERAAELQALANSVESMEVKTLDISDESSIQALAKDIDEPIDILIINAGILASKGSLADISSKVMVDLFKTNAVGHLLMAKYFVDHVARSGTKQILSVSSRMGSVADNSSGGSYAYRASKAADNAIMRSVALDTAELGIHVVIYHPGWVKTDMTNGNGNLSIEEAVSRLTNAIENARDFESGVFLSHDGSVLPW